MTRSTKMHFSRSLHFARLFLGLGVLLAGLLFAACSSPIIDSSEQSVAPSIDVVVTNYYTAAEGLHALVSPGTFAKADIKKFTVDGEDIDGAAFNGTAISINDDGVGTITNVSKTLWNLTLHAYSDEDGKNEVLRGYAMADTRNGDTTVSFTLSSYAVSTAGAFNLTFSYSNEAVAFTDDVTAVQINICDHDTHAVRYTMTITADTTPSLSDWTNGTGCTFAEEEVTAGYYYLEVVFKNTGKQIGIYTDILDIQPGRTTEERISITNKLFTKPDAPENVTVHRVDTSLSSDYYNAVIRWDDVATNEEYYEINVYTFSSITNSTGQLVATLDYTNYNTISFANGNAVGYAGGNLWYGSEEYVLRLKTGVLYDITVTAVNSLGRSQEIARGASVDETNITYGKLTGFGTSESAPYLHVNTFGITYSLNNGTWHESAAITETGLLLDYHVYKNEAIDLRIPQTIVDTENGETQEYPILYLGSKENPWSYWAKNSMAGAAITQATSWTNLFVIAQYTITDTTYEVEFDNNGLSLTATGTGASKDITATSTEVNSTTHTQVTISINTTLNDKFESFIIYINGVQQSSVSKTTPTYTFSIPFKGTYTVQIAGVYSNTRYFSTEYVFTVN